MAVKHLVLEDGIPKARNTSLTFYDESVVVGAPISAGTNITLPNSETYTSDDLQVSLNNIRLESVEDWNVVGSPPRTAIQLTFDAEVGDVISFRKIS